MRRTYSLELGLMYPLCAAEESSVGPDMHGELPRRVVGISAEYGGRLPDAGIGPAANNRSKWKTGQSIKERKARRRNKSVKSVPNV